MCHPERGIKRKERQCVGFTRNIVSLHAARRHSTICPNVASTLTKCHKITVDIAAKISGAAEVSAVSQVHPGLSSYYEINVAGTAKPYDSEPVRKLLWTLQVS